MWRKWLRFWRNRNNPWVPIDPITGEAPLVIPYPHHLPKNVLAPGRFYDIESWRSWYSGLGFDIEDIYRTDFLADSQCTIYQYRTGLHKRRFLDGADIAVVDPITVMYTAPPPTYT